MLKPSIIPRYQVGRINISAVNMDQTLDLIHHRVAAQRPGYICVANVRAAVHAQTAPDFCTIQNSSFLTLPDGMPLTWYARAGGLSHVGKVSGPDLMHRILARSAQHGHSHYFYGSTPDILQAMKRKLLDRFDNLDVRHMVSPPFRPLTEDEMQATADDINRRCPTFVWVGLGAPKQEHWMHDMIPRIDNAILIGVGAAFRFAAGQVRRPPQLISRIGLEWLYRCIQQPITARRFIKPFFVFNGMLLAQTLRRLQGRRASLITPAEAQ